MEPTDQNELNFEQQLHGPSADEIDRKIFDAQTKALADARQMNRSLLAQLDEARAEVKRLENQDWEEDLDDATAEVARQLVAMTKRKDGWRRVALMYRKDHRFFVMADVLKKSARRLDNSELSDGANARMCDWSRARREERQEMTL